MTKVVQLETPKAPEIVSDLEPVLRLDGSLEEVELETRRRRNGPRSEVRMRATRRRVCCRWELIGAVLLVWASLSWLLVECQRTASKGGASVSSSSTVGPHKETDQSGAGASGTASKARGTQSLGAGTKVGPVCQYEKGRWAECTADGFQLKVQKLKTSAGENGPNSAACQPSKTIRRDCKPGEYCSDCFQTVLVVASWPMMARRMEGKWNRLISSEGPAPARVPLLARNSVRGALSWRATSWSAPSWAPITRA